MRKLYIGLVLLLPPIFVMLLESNNLESNKSLENINPYNNATVSIETFCNADSTWGFDIYLDGKLFIHQEIITSGTSKGFKSEQEAVKSAGVIIQKIRKNIVPHILTSKELDSLNIQF
jgi:hypothetical protein